MTGLRAVKMLGQNFLTDRNVVERIVAQVEPGAGDHILEIGPGQGALTGLLADSGATVVAVELDRRLAPLLASRFAANERVRIVEGDILETDLTRLLGDTWPGPWKVVANLPYNISSQVLLKFLETPRLFTSLVLMLQKEVGDRLAAPPGCKEYGVLTLFASLHFHIRRAFVVRPGAFHPVPKVDSAVLRFDPLPAPRAEVGDEALFRRVVKAAFAQRRKTLWNCFRAAGLLADGERLAELFRDCAIDPGRRGETLCLEEFALLTRALLAMGAAAGK
jgi:16S rRNA (adenine1518-N6/adenine1519-N6)-dimethyltransferase